jgi:hypothetical protein
MAESEGRRRGTKGDGDDVGATSKQGSGEEFVGAIYADGSFVRGLAERGGRHSRGFGVALEVGGGGGGAGEQRWQLAGTAAVVRWGS